MRPRLLDLFCGAGGCAVGYHRAGFDVIGVDINPQPNYPFEFIQHDAMTFPLDGFDAIHASPPCQAYSIAKHINGNGHTKVDLVAAVRDRVSEFPYVIENVQGSPLQRGSVMLCGLMFGLPLYRHRYFESSETLFGIPPHPKHRGTTLSRDGYSAFANGATVICVAGHNFRREDGAVAMGIDWRMTREEMSQAVPPVYTEWVGNQFIERIRSNVKTT